MSSKRATPGNPEKLAFYLLKAVSKANRVYRLFDAGDRIAVAVSGGKDSATLLDLLLRWPGLPRFELAAVHVTAPEEKCGDGVGVDALCSWFDSLDIESRIVPLEPAGGRPTRKSQGPCFHCAWRRRKAIFTAAKSLGCNKVAFAHHADDVAVTTLLNLVYQGRFETMQARQEMFDGEVTIIRPLYFVEEREIVRFAGSGIFPFEPATCMSGGDARRARMTDILRLLEGENRHVKRSIMNALEYACPPPPRKP